MNLLIITQRVDKNDAMLGFFHDWLDEFSRHWAKLTVIALEVRDHDLPGNVEVLSLGKDRLPKGAHPTGILRRSGLQLGYVLRFYHHIFSRQSSYTHVFIHMNPVYCALGGPLWRSWGKRSALWYLHKRVDLKLRIAEKLVDRVFTASPESFRLSSAKVSYMGLGIIMARFEGPSKDKKYAGLENRPIRIASIGRITQIKDLQTLIKAAAILKERGISFIISIVGSPASAQDFEYKDMLEKSVKEKGLDEEIIFIPEVPFEKIAAYYCGSDLTVNLCPTGGLDKAVIESLACKTLAMTANMGFEEIYGENSGYFIFEHGNAQELARKIMAAMKNPELDKISGLLQNKIKEDFSLKSLIRRVCDNLKNL